MEICTRKDGVLRDVRGRLQLPLVMYKRNSIERDGASNSINRYLSYPTYQKYNSKNKYDKFSLMNGVKPNAQNYNITVPDYVSITYEVMVWTSFTEHMNKIVEQFQWPTDDYWGDKDKFKFRVRIDSFDNQSEVGQGSERIVRTTFNMVTLISICYQNNSIRKKLILYHLVLKKSSLVWKLI